MNRLLFACILILFSTSAAYGQAIPWQRSDADAIIPGFRTGTLRFFTDFSDSDSTHAIKPRFDNATGDRILLVNLGDADRSLTLAGDATISGTNTGDNVQTITLTGDVTGSGTGTFAATIQPNSVALTTDTTGNYALGDAEGGAATTGDSAAAFFGAGELEIVRGGTGATTLNNLITLGTHTVGSYAAGDAEFGNAITGDTATAFFAAGLLETARGGTGLDTSALTGVAQVAAGVWSVSTLPASGVAADTLDFSEFKDTMTLDANLAISASASNFGINIDSNTLVVDTVNNRVGIGSASLNHDLSVIRSVAGSPVNICLQNTDNTNAASHAYLYMATGGSSGGDAKVFFGQTGEMNWSFGVDNSDSNKFKIAASGALESSTMFTIQTDGLTGVGTSDPTKTLTVNGDSNALAQIGIKRSSVSAANHYGQIEFIFNGGAGDTTDAASIRALIQNAAASQAVLVFRTSAAERMRVDEVGLVGILDPAPDASVDINNDGVGDSLLVADSGDGDTTPFVIQSDGDAGFGTASPVSKVDITYSNSNYTNTGGAGAHLLFNNNGGSQTVIGSYFNGTLGAKWRTDSSGNVNWVAGGGYHAFYTGGDVGDGGTAKMRIDNNGNIGIATNVPDYPLDVNGPIGSRQQATDPADPDSGAYVMWMAEGTGAGDAGDLMVKINVGGVTKTVTLIDYSLAP